MHDDHNALKSSILCDMATCRISTLVAIEAMEYHQLRHVKYALEAVMNMPEGRDPDEFLLAILEKRAYGSPRPQRGLIIARQRPVEAPRPTYVKSDREKGKSAIASIKEALIAKTKK